MSDKKKEIKFNLIKALKMGKTASKEGEDKAKESIKDKLFKSIFRK